MATRRERVILELQDMFTKDMMKAAGATALLNRELHNLSGTSVQSSRSTANIARDIDRVRNSSEKTGHSIDQLSGRMALLGRVLGVGGPGIVPIVTSAVPLLAGLATQIGFAAAAGGTAILAFQGVGDALEAMNKARLEPTTENLEAARVAMANLTPAAQGLVKQLREMGPALKDIQQASAEGLMPGLTDSLVNLEPLLPKIADIVQTIGDATGDMLADSAASLASDRWSGFFDFLQNEARPTITTLGQTVGNLTHGLAELWMQLNPLSDDFTGGLLQASERFDAWAQGLSQTEGFADFMAYVRETGPQVVETVGSLANAILKIGEAAAPLGGPVLQGIEAFADAVAAIADSPLGTPIMAAVTAMSALSLATQGWAKIAGASWMTATAGATGYTAAASRAAAAARASMLLRGGLAFAAGSMIAPELNSLGGSIDSAQSAQATADLAAMEEALAGLLKKREDLQNVTGGKDFFGDLADTVTGSTGLAPGLQDINDEIDRTREGIADLKNETGASANSDAFSRALGLVGDSADDATNKVSRLQQQLISLNNALTGRASWRDYEAALDAVTESIKQNGKTLNITTAAGRANQAALDGIAATSIKVAENLRGLDRRKYLQRARQDFINAAMDLGKTRDQARALADELGLVDRKKVKPKIDVDTGAATSKTNAYMQLLRGLDGDRAVTYIDVITRRSTQTIAAHNNPDNRPANRADGGEVPGQRHPYGDKTLILAAPGEEIITNRNGEADRFRADRAAGRIPAYANGGTVDLDSMRRTQRRGQRFTSSGRGAMAPTHVVISGHLSGTVRTPWGDAPIEGKIREIARDEINSREAWEGGLDRDE